MKKWLIPVAALFVVAIIALITWKFVLKDPEHGSYKLYLVAMGDKGKQGSKVGCDDSLVPLERKVVSDVHITDVYQDIVDLHEPSYDDENGKQLSNPLYQSNLTYESAIIDANGVARVDLNGTLTYKDTCDADRIKAQLEQPARQFETVKSVDVRINDVDLQTLLKPAQNQ
jgi:Sporulation and spore germination.